MRRSFTERNPECRFRSKYVPWSRANGKRACMSPWMRNIQRNKFIFYSLRFPPSSGLLYFSFSKNHPILDLPKILPLGDILLPNPLIPNSTFRKGHWNDKKVIWLTHSKFSILHLNKINTKLYTAIIYITFQFLRCILIWLDLNNNNNKIRKSIFPKNFEIVISQIIWIRAFFHPLESHVWIYFVRCVCVKNLTRKFLLTNKAKQKYSPI